MTKEQFDREKKYQAALAVAREMLQKGIINEADFLRIEARLEMCIRDRRWTVNGSSGQPVPLPSVFFALTLMVTHWMMKPLPSPKRGSMK